MHTILTHLTTTPIDGLLDNHRQYTTAHGYRHVVEDANRIYGERQRSLHRYHCIYRELQALPDQGLLLVLDQFCVIFHPHDLNLVAQGYDAIVSSQAASGLATPSGMIFRKTADNLEKLRGLIQQLSQWAVYLEGHANDAEIRLLGECFPAHPFVQRLNNGYFASVQGVWIGGMAMDGMPAAQPLVAHTAPEWELVNGHWRPSLDYDFRFVQCLLEMASNPGLEAPHQAFEHVNAQAQAPSFHLNPEADIAFVTLYTPNIAGYGVLHEQSMIRYCQRHGYGYHAYRQTPAFIDPSVSANWAKAHLIRHHLPQHQFVLWIDADILAINQSIGMERDLESRDFTIGTDHTAWPINSCVFGMRNTPDMMELVHQMCSRIEEVTDKSSVYASGGDQQIIMEALIAAGKLNASHIRDAISLATSPIYATPQDRFVHFPAQANHYRALSMQIWNRFSQ